MKIVLIIVAFSVFAMSCRSITSNKKCHEIMMQRDNSASDKYELANPFVEVEDRNSLAGLFKTKHPKIVIRKLDQITVLCDSDVINALVGSLPNDREIDMTYRGTDLSWNYRQSMPNETFIDLLKKEPNLYQCFLYLRQFLRVELYCLDLQNETRIFLLDTMNGEDPVDMLPIGAIKLEL